MNQSGFDFPAPLSEKYRPSATTYYKTTSGIGRTLLAFE